jgi:inner membrane protein
MKWITHQTAGVGAALALHLPLEGVVAACLGAILPDKLDQAIAKRSRNPQRTFNQIHRGTTHWFGWWVAILLVACSHVVLDMLTPSGIPLHPFSRKNKLSFKVCSTGSVGEYVFLGVMLVLLGFLLGPEMKELIRHVRQLGMPVLHF